jgi:hypothetical protein
MRDGYDIDRCFWRMLAFAYGVALGSGVAFAGAVGLLIYVFHIPGRVVAGLIASLFR